MSNCEAAACATAYLGDLIWAGMLPSGAAYLAVDPLKVKQARDKVLEDAVKQETKDTADREIKTILFDASLDKTKVPVTALLYLTLTI